MFRKKGTPMGIPKRYVRRTKPPGVAVVGGHVAVSL